MIFSLSFTVIILLLTKTCYANKDGPTIKLMFKLSNSSRDIIINNFAKQVNLASSDFHNYVTAG